MMLKFNHVDLIKAETKSVGFTGQDHSLKVIDSHGSGFGVGFCHGNQVPYTTGGQ